MKQFFKISNIYKWLFKCFSRLNKKDIIIFDSFNGSNYSDNPKALYEYAKEHYPDYQLYWYAKKGHTKYFEENNIPYFSSPSWKELTYQTRAKYWIVNARTPKWKQPGANTIVLQTWHGTPLKRLGLDIKEVTMPGVTTKEYYQNFLDDTKKWTYLLADNLYSADIFSRAFQIDKNKIKVLGYPRNDKLFNYNHQEIETLKEQMGIDQCKDIILYAPTWRDQDNDGPGKYYLDLELDLQRFTEEFPDKILLIRAHYLISQNLNLGDYPNVIDVSDYPDISYLYLISDLLITDYSSVFFDYANLNRPMIFYAYDLDKYRDITRGFYMDYKEVPGPIVKTEDQLFTEIKRCLNSKYDLDLSDFCNKFCNIDDGNACQRVFKLLLNSQEEVE